MISAKLFLLIAFLIAFFAIADAQWGYGYPYGGYGGMGYGGFGGYGMGWRRRWGYRPWGYGWGK